MPDEGLDNLEVETIETPEAPDGEEDNSQETDESQDPKEKRHAQQLAGSKQEAERLRGLASDMAFERAQSNIETLKDLYSKDPKLAKSTADKFDREGSAWGSFQNFISDKQQSSSKISEEELDRMLEEREVKKEHTRSLERIEKAIGKLPEEIQESVQQYVDKYSKGKSLDRDTADELIEMATLFVNRGKLKDEKKQDVLEKMSSTGISNSKKPENDGDKFVVRRGKLVPLED